MFGMLISLKIGLELVGITAYEARNLEDLRRPSKTIGYIVLCLYMIHTFAEIMVVPVRKTPV